MNKKQKGFTLIEVLIVVAIVGILASVVLVGLGPVQKRGRDARRISDLRQVQTGLELYYTKNSAYPPSSDWATLTTNLKNANVGISNLPKEPVSTKFYLYSSNGSSYVLGATLEDANNPVFNEDIDVNPIANGFSCTDPVYCVAL